MYTIAGLYAIFNFSSANVPELAAADGGRDGEEIEDDRGGVLILLIVALCQVLNSVIGLVSATVFVAGAISVVFLTTALCVGRLNFYKGSLVEAYIESGYADCLGEAFLADLLFYAPTVFFIVLRPVMNLGTAVMMSAVLSYATVVIFVLVLPAKAFCSPVVVVFFMIVLFFIKLFTALLQTYFLYIFSSAMINFL